MLPLVGQLPPPRERDAERVELLHRPADAHPEDQASPAEVVEVRGHPGDQQRVPVGTIKTVVPGRILPVDAGQPGKRGERFVERRRVLRRDVRCHRNVVGNHQQVKAEAFHGCAQRRKTPGSVPGPKFGTFTPIRTGQDYPAIIQRHASSGSYRVIHDWTSQAT